MLTDFWVRKGLQPPGLVIILFLEIFQLSHGLAMVSPVRNPMQNDAVAFRTSRSTERQTRVETLTKGTMSEGELSRLF